jgi:glycosyltransferase involved in cell wall biosynthesis
LSSRTERTGESYTPGLAEPSAGRRYSILLVSHSYPPVLGGSEIEAQRVSKALIARGHRVQVLCAGGPPMPDRSEWIDPCGVPVRIFGSTGRWRDHEFAAGVVRTIIAERQRIDAVYFLMQGLHLAAGLPVARALGIPIVMKFSSTTIIPNMKRSFLGRLELRWLQRWAHRVMLLNTEMEQEAVEAGFRRDQLLWMPNPVDVNEFTPLPDQDRNALRAKLDIPRDSCVIVFVGRLAPEKRLPSLIRAFARLNAELPECLLVLIGDGAERNALESLAQQTGARGIRFAGRVPVDSVRRWVQASDIFALVSYREGLPCSLIEAMAAGLPSVVSDIPATRQLVTHGESGFLCEPGNEDQIAAMMAQLVRDPAERRQFGAAARKAVIRNYSTDEVVTRYEELLASALA